MQMVLYCKNLVAFKHACQLLENFDPLDFPPQERVEVHVKIANKKRTYYFTHDRRSFLKKQLSLLDNVKMHIKQGENAG
ncbi:MAG: hypothetical protein GWO20_07785 [Candidatus Korarchaeota archaeon]|nr:hypothetical protein [Candidatus Korarchaeota archaeon]NIU83341.1 hypothetical protein [Candidatus Thorarchaeota archaeon]NIW13672.1 hypothetical protein [Candidatus Thorarchaeota archaeon]NIW51771.1 hypothetical protein [Candidatus Korarchaeota archaeon]